MDRVGVGDLIPRDGVGDFGVGVGDLGPGVGDLAAGVGDLGPGVGDLGIGVEAGVEAGVGLFMDDAGVWALDGTGVGVLEGGAGDFAGAGVAAGVAAGVVAAVLGIPSLGSGIFSPCL